MLITVDTCRADHLGCYGHEGIDTPNMDALAEEGILFEQCAAHVPITLPSHASILTGIYPNALGLRDNAHGKLQEDVTTLAEVLRQEGFSTAAFISAFAVDARFGLDQGFQVYDAAESKGALNHGAGLLRIHILTLCEISGQ